jgi:hypothetical protein
MLARRHRTNQQTTPLYLRITQTNYMRHLLLFLSQPRFITCVFQFPISRSPTFDRNAMVQPHQSHLLPYSALTSVTLAMNIRNTTYTDVSFVCFLLAFTHFNRIHAFSFAVNIGRHFHVAIILAL